MRRRNIGRYIAFSCFLLNFCTRFVSEIDSPEIRQLHEQGKTDQAKSDLARLAKIRAEREQASARRKAEAEGGLIFYLHGSSQVQNFAHSQSDRD
jgi:hypothetical protein